MTAREYKLEGFKTRDVHTASGKKGVFLDLFPLVQPRPGQSQTEASKAAAVSFLLEEGTARDLIAAIADSLATATPPSGLQRKH